MPVTEEMTITVSTEVAKILREGVSSGRYASESQFVEEAVWAYPDPGVSDDVMEREVLPVYDSSVADPSQNIPLEEARARMAERHKNYVRAAA